MPIKQPQPNPTTPSASSSFSAFQDSRDKRHAQFYTGLTNGLFEPRHERKMGKAVWFFGWLVGRETVLDGSAGLVFGGRLLTWKWLAARSGWPERTLQRWARILRSRSYIEIELEQHGFTLKIRNAKKFLPRQQSLFPGSPLVANLATNGGTKSGDPGTKSGEPAVSILLMKSVGAEGKVRTSAQDARSSRPSLAGEFQKLAEQTWTLRYQGAKPTWGSAEFTVLAQVAKKHPELGLQELGAVWESFLGSTLPFIADRGHNPKDFRTYFDRLRRGPVLERRAGTGRAPTAGKTNGGGKFAAYNRKATDFL